MFLFDDMDSERGEVYEVLSEEVSSLSFPNRLSYSRIIQIIPRKNTLPERSKDAPLLKTRDR